MPKSRIPSPARSQRVPVTPRRYSSRGTRSVGSPARSTASGCLSTVIDQFKGNRQSFVASPLDKTFLTDDTDIEMPRRKSWWKNVETSRDAIEVLDHDKPAHVVSVLEELDLEVLSQEKKEYTVDIPESSDSESISSIIIPQRKLFTQKEHVLQIKYKQVVWTRESMAKHNKTQTEDKLPDTLFTQTNKRPKPVFPAALLNLSPDKTVGNKTKDLVVDVKDQARNLFGNRPGTKRKNMFADFIVSESEDDISEIQPKLFAFRKPERSIRRSSVNSRGIREPSPATSITTEMALDEWQQLPSSTLIEHQIQMQLLTPAKKSRLSKLSEAKESTATNLSKQSIKSSPRNKSKILCGPTKEQHKSVRDNMNASINKSKENVSFNRNTKNEIKNLSKLKDKSQASKVVKVGEDFESSNLKDKSPVFSENEEISQNIKNQEGELNAQEIIQNYQLNVNDQEQEDEDEQMPLTYEDYDNEEMLQASITVYETKNVSKDVDDLEHKIASIVGEDMENIVQTETLTQEKSSRKSNKVINETPGSVHVEKDEDSLNNIKASQIELQEPNQSKDKQQDKDAVNKVVEDNEKELEKSIVDRRMAKESDHEQAADNEQEQTLDSDQEQILDSDQEQEVDSDQEEAADSDQEQAVDSDQEQAEASDQEATEIEQELETAEEDEENIETDLNQDSENVNEPDSEQDEMEEDYIEASDGEQNESQEVVQDDDKEQIDSHEIDVQENDEKQDESPDNDEDQEDDELNESQELEESQGAEVQNESQEFEGSQGAEVQNESQEADDIHYESEIEGDAENYDQAENEHDEIQKMLDDNIENTEDIQDTEPQQHDDETNVSHDTTGRNRKKHETNSPVVILHDMTNELNSFTTKGRDTSIRKTKSIVKNFTIRQSLAPARESTGLEDGTKNSSAEGSGWDSHRTTRKTMRQTFGKDFTPRKSLRTLVMEKSAKRQTAVNEANARLEDNTVMDYNDVEPSELDHETKRLRLEMCAQKIRQENMEFNQRIKEKVQNFFKANPLHVDPLNFPIPSKTAIKRANMQSQSVRSTAPKVKRRKPAPIIDLENVPQQLLKDMKYRPPKRFKPRNVSWVTNRLYKYLEGKLEPKYDYKARVRAEKLVETIYNFVCSLKGIRIAPSHTVAELKREMARLNIVNTHFEFYNFFHDYLPVEIKVKVVPDIVNKIPLPQGLFSPILDTLE